MSRPSSPLRTLEVYRASGDRSEQRVADDPDAGREPKGRPRVSPDALAPRSVELEVIVEDDAEPCLIGATRRGGVRIAGEDLRDEVEVEDGLDLRPDPPRQPRRIDAWGRDRRDPDVRVEEQVVFLDQRLRRREIGEAAPAWRLDRGPRLRQVPTRRRRAPRQAARSARSGEAGTSPARAGFRPSRRAAPDPARGARARERRRPTAPTTPSVRSLGAPSAAS